MQDIEIKFRRRASAWLLTILLLQACAVLPHGVWPPAIEGLPPERSIDSVPFFAQEEYQCGPAALAMALAASGLDVRPAELTPKVYTPSLRGSLQPALVAGARRYGRLAYEISGTEALLREIAAGHPVIVLQNLGLSWLPVWHYAVAVGYDLPRDEIILHTGLTAGRRVAMGIFQNSWAPAENWGMLVLAADQLPQTATEEKYVQAVIGLEKAKQPAAALQGYQAALKRWPGNLAAGIGLGNSYYALGDLKNAEAAFRTAAELHPREGAAFNNWADVLLQLGRREEALAAARRAVALGGPLLNVFQKTLQEVEAAPP